MPLTDEQQKVVESPVKNKLLLAGPGTGKSFTIMGLVRYLIEEQKEDPKNIYVITFTRAATKELKKNLLSEFSDEAKIPHVFTLHGFSLRQLVRNAHKVRTLPTSFGIADDYEERFLIKEDIKRYLNVEKIKDIHRLFNLLSSNWETLNADTQDWEITFESPEFIGLWKEHREIYRYGLRSELVYQFKKLLDQGEDIRLDAPINFLLVDEYQDLNRCDISIVKHLNQTGARLFVAGDDDQSIYGFRYAYPEAIRNFKQDIKESDQFILNECKRCDESILELALNVIRQDHLRIPKKIRSVTGGIGEVHLLKFRNQNEEAANIARIIRGLTTNGVHYKDIIILMRSDSKKAFSTPIEKALAASEIPINKEESDLEIFNEHAGRYFLGLIKYLIDNTDCLALRTIINLTPSIGNKTIDGIYSYARSNNIKFNEVLLRILSREIQLDTNIHLIINILERLEQLKEAINKEEQLDKQVDTILSFIPFDISHFTPQIHSQLVELEIKELRQIPMVVSETSFFGEPPDVLIDGVRIMTMHRAKGLTAPVVFVIAAEDEYLPGKNDVNEERRLFYVSLTRAKHSLFITYCHDRIGQQKFSGYTRFATSRRNLSRYLSDLPTLTAVDGTNFSL